MGKKLKGTNIDIKETLITNDNIEIKINNKLLLRTKSKYLDEFYFEFEELKHRYHVSDISKRKNKSDLPK